MKTKQTTPIILARDEAAINDFRQRLETIFTPVAKMTDLYFKFPFASPMATPGTIFSNTASQAESYKATNLPESMNVAGMTLDRNKFAKFMTIPGMDEFQAARDQITALNGESLLPYYKIVDKMPEIDEGKFQQYADAHSVMARTETDRQLYAVWVRMIEGLTQFNDMVKNDFTFLAGLTAPKLGMYLRENKKGEIVPNPELFAAISKELNKKGQ
jgi:hypothetical protein